MKIKLESDYERIKRELGEVKVNSSIKPVDGGNFSIADLMREYYSSEHHLKYNTWKFTLLIQGYDTFNSMEDYFKKLNLVAVNNHR